MWLTRSEIEAAHAQFGQLHRDAVREAMGPNWPSEWDASAMFVADDVMAAARAAVERHDASSVDEWAERLGADLSKFRD